MSPGACERLYRGYDRHAADLPARGAGTGGRGMSDTIHRIVTERMIAALERGTVPWRKPWQAAAGRPRSMGTGQPTGRRRGPARPGTAAEEGYGSPFWGTYRQIGDLGGQVRQGERSTLVVFWKQSRGRAPRPADRRDSQLKQLPVLRYYRVFNAAQADHPY